jgi:ornithine decarboxylase
VRKLLDIGVEPERIIFGAPVKVEEHIVRAYREGVDLYAYDSYAEVAKLAAAAPGCRVYLRLAVPDRGASVFPLSKKFGASPREAVALLSAAELAGLRPVGLSFHVGSQCLEPSAWWLAVATAAWVWNRAKAAGMRLHLLNMGGGIPIRYAGSVLAKEVFLSNLNLAVRGHFHRRPRLIIEPGRSLVGDAAVMVATVIGKARRDGQEWLYLDAGIYQGLVEAVQERERFSYLVYAQGNGPLRRYCLGGPTCDAGDVVARDVVIPELQCGDRVYVMSAGAYTNACSTAFNGFEPPAVHFMSGEG